MKKASGKCYGKWSVTDPACGVCLGWCRVKCEEATKRRLNGQGVVIVDDSVPVVEPDPVPEFTPTDYLLKTLEGKFERKVQWGENGACGHNFVDNGKTVVYVSVHGVSGAIRVMSHKLKIPKIMRLESVEEAEELLKQIL